jgi:hypothetical protein
MINSEHHHHSYTLTTHARTHTILSSLAHLGLTFLSTSLLAAAVLLHSVFADCLLRPSTPIALSSAPLQSSIGAASTPPKVSTTRVNLRAATHSRFSASRHHQIFPRARFLPGETDRTAPFLQPPACVCVWVCRCVGVRACVLGSRQCRLLSR